MTEDYYDKDFLKQRIIMCNKFHNTPDDCETFHVTIKRSTKAFLLDLFFGYISFLFYLSITFCLLLYLFVPELEFLLFMCLIIFCYLVRICYKSCLWRYFKYIVLSNLGVYILTNNLSGRYKGFNGKKQFIINVSWSLYDWHELSQIKTYSNTISRMFRLKNITLCRWDGNEDIPYLKKEDYDKIMDMAKQNINRKRKKKEGKINRTPALDFLEKVEKFYMGRREEVEEYHNVDKE